MPYFSLLIRRVLSVLEIYSLLYIMILFTNNLNLINENG